MSDAAALAVDGFRLAAALLFGGDVFHRDNHVAGVSRIGRGDDAHGKARAVAPLAGGLGRYRLTLLHLLHDGLDGRPGLVGHQSGRRNPHQFGGRVAIDQLRPPVDFEDSRRGDGQVGHEDADRHRLE